MSGVQNCGGNAGINPPTTPGGPAGGDLSGTYPDPNVRGIHETAGPTQLLFGAIADGTFLVRSGGNVVGAALAFGNPVAISDSTNDQGVSPNLARADHVHSHGVRGGGTLHALTASTGNGFQPASNRAGTRAPNEGDDSDDGYAVGSYWCDTTNDQNYVCLDATVGAAIWSRTCPETARFLSRIREDWCAATTAGSTNWSSTASGAGAASAVTLTNQDATHPGVLLLSTGTTNAGRVGHGPWTVGVPTYQFNTDQTIFFECNIRFDNLPTLAEDYAFRVGFGDVKTNAGFAEGAYFTLGTFTTRGDTFWRAATTAASVTTETNSNVNATTAAWQRLTIVKLRGTSTWKFYIDGALVATHTTNVPTGPAAPVMVIQKSVGNTARLAFNDYVDCLVDLGAPRAA